MECRKITVVAGLIVKPDFVDSFIEKSKEVTEQTRAEEGCLRYDFYRDVFNSNAFAFVEEYKDSKAFEAHRDMPYMTTFREFRARAVDKYLGVSELSEISKR